jgi:hypothetical protein
MKTKTGRRSFFKKSLAAALAVPAIKSVEEYTLVAEEPKAAAAASPAPPVPGSKAKMPTGKIGKVQISRVICGGNLISGYAHSRDLIYVSTLLKNYFTRDKIMQTWAGCEEHGINTMIFNPSDKVALDIYRNYRAQGGKMQCIAQISPKKDAIAQSVKEAADAGVCGILLVGNDGDAWTREGDIARVGEFVNCVKAQGVIAGVAGHELRTPMAVEKAGIKPDFYMKTLHNTNYWSKRRPDQMKEVIDNYGIDNYWCMDPEGTIRFMLESETPWIAYKVLAAGAIPPKVGFKYAFENGADFCCVGMFDFQIAENVAVANEVIAATQNRERPWIA